MPTEGLKRGVTELANAMESGTNDDVTSAWLNLPTRERELFKPLVKREIEGRSKK
jgi:hypothetical protein